MGRARVKSSDGGIVKQAEPHGTPGFGMVAGRADGGESVTDLAAQDRKKLIELSQPPAK